MRAACTRIIAHRLAPTLNGRLVVLPKPAQQAHSPRLVSAGRGFFELSAIDPVIRLSPVLGRINRGAFDDERIHGVHSQVHSDLRRFLSLSIWGAANA